MAVLRKAHLLETIMATAHRYSPLRSLVIGFALIAAVAIHYAAPLWRGLVAISRSIAEFALWVVARTYPVHPSILTPEVALYEVGRSRALAYADTRRATFDRRHVDQGWLAAA